MRQLIGIDDVYCREIGGTRVMDKSHGWQAWEDIFAVKQAVEAFQAAAIKLAEVAEGGDRILGAILFGMVSIGISYTGSGKSLAFILPAIEHIKRYTTIGTAHDNTLGGTRDAFLAAIHTNGSGSAEPNRLVCAS